MHISGGYFNAQNKSPLVAGCVRFVSELSLMLSLYEHSAVRVRDGNRLFYRFSSSALGMIFVVLVFNGLLAQLFSFLVDLSAQLSGIDLCRLCNLFLPELFLVGTGLDMGAVNENRARVDHSVIERFVKNMLKNLAAQLVRKALAEGVAHRRKVRNLIEQPIAQKPAI